MVFPFHLSCDTRRSVFGLNANSKGPDQPVEIYSLIRNFVMFYSSQLFHKGTVLVLIRMYELCILRHQDVQLILAYSWARPAIIVAGKGRGEMFLFHLFP